MTMIISCLTQSDVIQVSDRRVTYADGKIKTSQSNKAVVLGEGIVLGYTGLAELGPEYGKYLSGISNGKHIEAKERHTDQWMTEILMPIRNLDGVLDTLAEKTQNELNDKRFANIGNDIKRITFVGVGWMTPSGKKEDLAPIICSASNFEGLAGETINNTDNKLEKYSYVLPKDIPYIFTVNGQKLSEVQIKTMTRQVRRALKEFNPASVIIEVFANTILSVSRVNPRVGNSMMASVIPKLSLPLFTIDTPKLPLPLDKATFLYFRGKDSNNGTTYMPNFVPVGGGMSFTNISMS